MSKVIRVDSKKRILGDKSYVGDQEIIGKLGVSNRSNQVIYEFDPDENTVTVYDNSGDNRMPPKENFQSRRLGQVFLILRSVQDFYC